MNINIHIPVDIRATDSFDYSSGKEPVNWPKPVEKEEPVQVEVEVPAEATETIAGIVDQSYIFVPSFPLYGGASAGPNGITVLNDPEFTTIDWEIASLRIAGKEYRIYSTKKGDLEVSISNTDFLTSILSPYITQQLELNGKKHGWLKVIGNSMSKASPVPIENEDYVLFTEGRDPAACIGKIVVASLPVVGTHATRLIIKRLIKSGNKYFFHSESIYDKDPKTGDDFTKDLEISTENQLIGIVEAVASTKPKNLS
jgi:hypothetical protein